ncbi:MAG: signal recognition particle-docking protein FtsY [Verrucomicrobia bacterium GWF2_51_19]|nr:MAG: signal recognition particle-docking protein FtsY [Verrucomicrobia bacterium GWF2_51_19]HCJ12529.1 signal recognition particle-docking protein FtsY [Opitutae bacterium]
MISLFSKFKKGFGKTAQKLLSAFGGIFGGIDAASLEVLEEALYSADFGVETATEILDAIKKAGNGHGEQAAAEIGAQVLTNTLDGAEGRINLDARPTVICLVGINGSGKTTTAAKLAHLFQEDGKKVLVGACDTFRAAANEQLEVWCQRLKIELVKSQQGADAAAVAYDAYQAAKNRGADVLILDTAGRLHNKETLMRELAKIKKVLQKHDSRLPHNSWLVLDGSIGANSIEQARTFHKEFGINGLILTKLDGTSRGGALVGIYRDMKIPIYFIGLGEQPDDLQPFSVEPYVQSIFYGKD